jgi:hypothetical protein
MQFGGTFMREPRVFDSYVKNTRVGQFLFNGGLCSVDTMFMISGYFAARDVMRTDYNYVEFLKHRFFRLAPQSWFIILVLLILNPHNRMFSVFDFTFTTNVLDLRQMFASHVWWLACEFQYRMLLAPIIVRNIQYHKSMFITACIVAVSVRVISIFPLPIDQSSYQNVHYNLLYDAETAMNDIQLLANSSYFAPHYRFLPFICGLYLAIEQQENMWGNRSKLAVYVACTIMIALTSCFYQLLSYAPKILFAIWSPLYSVSLYVVLRNVETISVLEWKQFKQISHLIYGSYLCHFLWICIQCVIIQKMGWLLPSTIFSCIIVWSTTLVLAFATSYFMSPINCLSHYKHSCPNMSPNMAVFIMVCVGSVLAHARWKYPVARSTDTGIKGPYPCGYESFFGPNQAVTTLTANSVVTLQWEETISHTGAPFRIALSYDDDSKYDKIVLFDHIPHNDQGGGDFSNPKGYSLNFTIPDISCSNCSLQLVNPMTDKIAAGSCCSYPTVNSNYCVSVYHSCANIVIKGGSKTVQNFAASYTNPSTCDMYTQESTVQLRYST